MQYVVKRLQDTFCWVDISKGNIQYIETRKGAHTYIALKSDGEIMGALTIRQATPNQPIIKSMCTGVKPKYHGKGIGSSLWMTMIRDTKPKRIIVNAISVAGKALVKSLANKYTNIEWKVNFLMDRAA